MKKICVLASLFVLFIAANCDNEPLEGDFITEEQFACQQAVAAQIDASEAFGAATSENYTELCNALKVTLEAQIAVCGDSEGQLQGRIDELGDCIFEFEPQTCEEATQVVENSKIDFDEATSETYSERCNAYKAALENQILACGDNNGTIQAIIDDLGNCIQNGETGGSSACGYTLVNVFNQPIQCNGDNTAGLEVANVYMEIGEFFSDEDGDGNDDHSVTTIYITDGTAELNDNSEFVSFTNKTFLLEITLKSAGLDGLTTELHKYFGDPAVNTNVDSVVSGGFFSNANVDGCEETQGEFYCDNRLLIINGGVFISGSPEEYELCFNVLLLDAETCFSRTFTGEFIPIDVF